MKPRFLWRRIPDSSDLGILPAAYMRELGSAYETLASLNQASDAISNLILKKKKKSQLLVSQQFSQVGATFRSLLRS